MTDAQQRNAAKQFAIDWKDPDEPETLKSLNMLCVRLVFCLYAEDAGIFGGHVKFHNYIKMIADRNIGDVRRGIIDLFRVLDTKPEDKDPYMDDELASFPYVNGRLFAEENIVIPRFTEEIVSLLLHNASEDFDWSDISPTIFGAVFESTLNPEIRRRGGIHYTSIENIHKVIDPLFLDELKNEMETIKEITVERTRNKKLEEFQAKLSGLVFFESIPCLSVGLDVGADFTWMSIMLPNGILAGKLFKIVRSAPRPLGRFKFHAPLPAAGLLTLDKPVLNGIIFTDKALTGPAAYRKCTERGMTGGSALQGW